MGLLSQILQTRSRVLYVQGPHQTVDTVIRLMAEQQIGAVPICENGQLIGIFSERDFLRRVAAKGLDPARTELRAVMTPHPITAAPDEDRLVAISKMQAIGCRHLPILANGTVIDMLSMRDLLFVEIAAREQEVAELRQYISGTY
ncbi:MAG: CBS domain-containing protein [Deltaproteobacteria bacterium]|nr:CBS domain-containing protein [Deltaproteobacteria bacterium]